MDFISLTKHNSGNEEVNTASVSTASTNVSPTSTNIGAASISQDTSCAYIASQSNDVVGFDKSKVECFNYHKMGHFAKECRASRNQDRGRRDNYRQRSKVEEQTPNALMAINGVGWDWSFMANKQKDHALVADEEAPTEFALMAKTSAESEVFNNSICSKNCKKNTESFNSKITDLINKLGDSKNMLFHYKAGLSQVEGRLAEFKSQEIKFCEKIGGLEVQLEFKINRIESLTYELELVKKEKCELDTKLTGFQTASKNLDSLLESQRLDKNKEGPSPAIESTSDDVQNRNSSETEASSSTILSKPSFKYVKATVKPTKNKTVKVESIKKSVVKNFPTVNRKFPTSSIKFSTADMGKKGNAVKASTCWIWKPSQNTTNKECIVLGRDFKLIDDTNVLLRTPRQHNMYSIDLNNIILHKDLTWLVAKAFVDECKLWHRRL
nr:ribonuclease H-like domain-containing protein [Tanacetum cinerariifolium]